MQYGEACLKQGDKKPIALKRKTISYNGQEVRISYDDDEITVILYCGNNEASTPPQLIGKVRN